MSKQTKFLLDENQMPKSWYNIQADLPKAAPAVLLPGTLQPIGPADLAPLFPMALIMQEVSQEREIEIPDPVQDIYRLWRPAPLYRAHRLEKALGTPAKIDYKDEGVNHAVKGAIEEALRCKREGKAETILFCLSGHGHFDMASYQKYFAGKLTDERCDESEMAMALAALPSVPELV